MSEHAHEWTDETARDYATKYGDWATNRLVAEAIDVAPDAVVADIGCGTGAALRALAGRVPAGRLIGVDPMAAMVEIATEQTAGHEGAARIEFRQGSAEPLPVDDDTLDVALALNSVHHFVSWVGGAREIARALKPGGRFYVAEDHDTYEMAGHTAEQIASTLREAGFELGEPEVIREGEVVFDLFCAVNPG